MREKSMKVNFYKDKMNFEQRNSKAKPKLG